MWWRRRVRVHIQYYLEGKRSRSDRADHSLNSLFTLAPSNIESEPPEKAKVTVIQMVTHHACMMIMITDHRLLLQSSRQFALQHKQQNFKGKNWVRGFSKTSFQYKNPCLSSPSIKILIIIIISIMIMMNRQKSNLYFSASRIIWWWASICTY